MSVDHDLETCQRPRSTRILILWAYQGPINWKWSFKNYSTFIQGRKLPDDMNKFFKDKTWRNLWRSKPECTARVELDLTDFSNLNLSKKSRENVRGGKHDCSNKNDFTPFLKFVSPYLVLPAAYEKCFFYTFLCFVSTHD